MSHHVYTLGLALLVGLGLIAAPPAVKKPSKTVVQTAKRDLYFEPVNRTSTLFEDQEHSDDYVAWSDPAMSIQIKIPNVQLVPEAMKTMGPKVLEALAPLGLVGTNEEEFDRIPIAHCAELTVDYSPKVKTNPIFLMRPKDQEAFRNLVQKVELLGSRTRGHATATLQNLFVVLEVSSFQFEDSDCIARILITTAVAGRRPGDGLAPKDFPAGSLLERTAFASRNLAQSINDALDQSFNRRKRS
jgi:hypothetical protein